jgi:hypothetical protein
VIRLAEKFSHPWVSRWIETPPAIASIKVNASKSRLSARFDSKGYKLESADKCMFEPARKFKDDKEKGYVPK